MEFLEPFLLISKVNLGLGERSNSFINTINMFNFQVVKALYSTCLICIIDYKIILKLQKFFHDISSGISVKESEFMSLTDKRPSSELVRLQIVFKSQVTIRPTDW